MYVMLVVFLTLQLWFQNSSEIQKSFRKQNFAKNIVYFINFSQNSASFLFPFAKLNFHEKIRNFAKEHFRERFLSLETLFTMHQYLVPTLPPHLLHSYNLVLFIAPIFDYKYFTLMGFNFKTEYGCRVNFVHK